MDARAWDKIRKKKNNRKQFFQGTITWSVLKKKNKTFKLKTSIAESARVHLCLDHVDNPAFK